MFEMLYVPETENRSCEAFDHINTDWNLPPAHDDVGRSSEYHSKVFRVLNCAHCLLFRDFLNSEALSRVDFANESGCVVFKLQTLEHSPLELELSTSSMTFCASASKLMIFSPKTVQIIFLEYIKFL
jgi:hypothetical protein